MVRPQDDGPEMQAVLDALDDPTCQRIIAKLDQPMTASELSETCDVPLSTTYRKLDDLSTASLVAEETEIRQDGHHTTRYRRDFEEVVIRLSDEQLLAVTIERPATPDERLERLWGEVRRGVR
ncbi:winged helix-turn-helix domain-containing protein [Halomarina pelagica]|uniref:winged helix-turn-helix domain-containing protein n=1 Tax=Halomarina pelagica TaxID=2961599 RepID=UPI0020C4617A|nr:helix-turn-helix domain-containing protein [Halomarina sp. BND7]